MWRHPLTESLFLKKKGVEAGVWSVEVWSVFAPLLSRQLRTRAHARTRVDVDVDVDMDMDMATASKDDITQLLVYFCTNVLAGVSFLGEP